MNFGNRIQTFLIVGSLALMTLTLTALSQGYEERMTEYSEKFLAYSQVFVKFASQSINTEADYDAALIASDVAKDFHQHTGYIGDFLLILKIIKKHETESALAARLLRLRIEGVIKECEDASERIRRIMQNVENASITATADDMSRDVIALQKDLQKILDEGLNKG